MTQILQNPRSSCALCGALATINAFTRAIPILHSGPGCAFQSAVGQIGPSGKNKSFMGGLDIPCSNMYEKEITFGGLKRLRETVNGTYEVFDGDMYFIVTGCAAEIIGEDVAAVVKEFSGQKEPLLYIETGGFKGDSYKGYELVMNAVVEHLTAESGPKEELTVNLLGIVPSQELFWAGTIEEVTRILNKLNVKVNSFFSAYQGLETIRSSSRAALNINFSPWLGKKVEQLYKDKFGVDTYHYAGIPYGPTDTSEFLRGLAEYLPIDKQALEQVIAEEERYYYSYASVPRIVSRRFAIIGDVNTVIGLTRFLVNDFGQIPEYAIVTDEVTNVQDRALIQERMADLEYAFPPQIYYEQDLWKIKEILRESHAKLIFGSNFDREIADEKLAAFCNVSFPASRTVLNKTYAGYRGVISLVEDGAFSR